MSDTKNLRLRIAEELNRQPSDMIGDPSLSLGLVINREINNAIRHYESTRFRWNEVRNEFIFVTVQGTRTYSLPASFVRMDTLKLEYNNAYVMLTERTWEEMEDQDRQITGSQGIPYEFGLYGNICRVYPVPNQALSALGSYIRRYGPTSLSGSYCQITTVGGRYSLTATSTASHNNRLNGWTTDGEELIRCRAKAAVKVNYLEDAESKNEMRALALIREAFLSVPERLAYESLRQETNAFLATGKIKPYDV